MHLPALPPSLAVGWQFAPCICQHFRHPWRSRIAEYFAAFPPPSARSGTPIFLDTPFIDTPLVLIVLSPARGGEGRLRDFL
jgi:hypothetical protein